MAKSPQLTDYVRLIIELFGRFRQERSARASAKLGRPFRYSEELFVILFMLMQNRRICVSKSQWRWLHKHPEVVEMLGWEQIPHCTTIGHRYKRLYELLQLFVFYIGQNKSGLAEQLDQSHLVEDKSLFKARGPVWHERMRKAGRIPPRLRNLDTDATWSRSAYHGWVYGYGLHMTCNQDAFPAMLQVETTAVSESQVLDQKEDLILKQSGHRHTRALKHPPPEFARVPFDSLARFPACHLVISLSHRSTFRRRSSSLSSVPANYNNNLAQS